MLRGCTLLVVVLLLLGVAGTTGAGQGSAFKHENTAANLKSLGQELHKAIYTTKDAQRAAALFQALLPDEERLKKALKNDVAKDALQAIAGMHKKQAALPLTPETLQKLARPEQTEVQVHGATTEEIRKYEKGSVAFKEFPGGAQRVAELALRPGLTFYELEFLEKGKDAGVKYHLFYWDGKQWTMLGPIWRVLK